MAFFIAYATFTHQPNIMSDTIQKENKCLEKERKKEKN